MLQTEIACFTGGRRADAPSGARQRSQGGPPALQKRLDDMMKEIEEEEKAQVWEVGKVVK